MWASEGRVLHLQSGSKSQAGRLPWFTGLEASERADGHLGMQCAKSECRNVDAYRMARSFRERPPRTLDLWAVAAAAVGSRHLI